MINCLLTEFGWGRTGKYLALGHEARTSLRSYHSINKYTVFPFLRHTFITYDVIEHEKWKVLCMLFLMRNVKLKCWLFEKFGLHHKIDHGTT